MANARARDGGKAKAHRRSAKPDVRAGEGQKITEREVEDIEELSSPRTPIIYEIVRRQGDEEMVRPIVSLWWSGVAAGMSMSFSLLAQAILQTHLPDAPWRPLVADLGYSVGFVMVVMSRQQLFTENTVTAVLPVMAEFTAGNLLKLARMWGVVLYRQFRRHAVCRFVLHIHAGAHCRSFTTACWTSAAIFSATALSKCFFAASPRAF